MLVIGIDGGGTKTMASLMDEEGHILGIGIAGASGINSVPLHVARNRIFDAVEAAFKSANMPICNVDAIFAGIGGLLTSEDRVVINHILSVLPCYSTGCNIHADNDVNNALAGGLAGRNGIAVIASTQSSAFGTNFKHQHHRCGGYGFKEGDAGSAYALGRAALKLATRAFDGRVEETPLTKELLEYLNLNHSADVYAMMDKYYDDRLLTSELAPYITKYANLNDIHALDIVNDNTDELAMCLYGVINALEFENKEIAIVGTLANANGIYNRQLIDKLQAIAPDFKILSWELIPVVGAALIALKLNKITLNDSIIMNAKETYKNF
ncbi:MAG: BadF/BadG/BcrA/BcrD ATPase family protein [Erysipelotrichaceae bacterium]